MDGWIRCMEDVPLYISRFHLLNSHTFLKIATFPSDTTSLLNAYSRHSIRYNKYIKCTFKTFHEIQQIYMGSGSGGDPGPAVDPGPPVDPGPAGTRAWLDPGFRPEALLGPAQPTHNFFGFCGCILSNPATLPYIRHQNCQKSRYPAIYSAIYFGHIFGQHCQTCNISGHIFMDVNCKTNIFFIDLARSCTHQPCSANGV